MRSYITFPWFSVFLNLLLTSLCICRKFWLDGEQTFGEAPNTPASPTSDLTQTPCSVFESPIHHESIMDITVGHCGCSGKDHGRDVIHWAPAIQVHHYPTKWPARSSAVITNKAAYLLWVTLQVHTGQASMPPSPALLCKFILHIHVNASKTLWGGCWRDSSVAKSIGCSLRGPWFNSQHPPHNALVTSFLMKTSWHMAEARSRKEDESHQGVL